MKELVVESCLLVGMQELYSTVLREGRRDLPGNPGTRVHHTEYLLRPAERQERYINCQIGHKRCSTSLVITEMQI